MRAVLSLAALLIVLAVIGVLVKQQLSATKLPVVSAAEYGTAGTQPEQVQQQLQQFKSDLDQSLQQGAARHQAID